MIEFDMSTERADSHLTSYLKSELPWFEGPVVLETFQCEQSNPIYRISAKSGSYLLRRNPAGKILLSAHAIS